MSCRQSSPPEAPSGQKSILWCLPAFVPEKSFQALSSLLAPALGACEGGREGGKASLSHGSKGRNWEEKGKKQDSVLGAASLDCG